MNKATAGELKEFAETIAKRFSNYNREGNFNNETFLVDEVIPMSDHSAVINFTTLLCIFLTAADLALLVYPL